MASAIAQRQRSGTWVVLLMFGITLLASGGAVILQGLGCNILIDHTSPEPATAYGFLMIPIHGLALAVLGALINLFRPENRFGWLVSIYSMLLMIMFMVSGYGECAFYGQAELPNGTYMLWLARRLEAISFLSMSILFWLFPNGRFLNIRWRRTALAGCVLVTILAGLQAIWPGPLRVDALGRNWITNPIALDIAPILWLKPLIENSANSGIMILFLAGVVSLVLRWRRSYGETRQQMKWLTYHLSLAGGLFMAVEVIGITVYPQIFDGWFYLFALLPFWIGLPLVFGLTIFKYRLYDIDLIIRRTLVYAALTLSLAATYLTGVLSLQALLVRLTGEANTIAVVGSTLVSAALFQPLRIRLQNLIDRQFFRKKYDPRQVVEQFALHARQEADLDAISAGILTTVQETLEPEKVQLWLVARDKQ